MNTAIELHDSELGAITYEGSSAVLLFAPAYLHRSTGRPGIDSGSGWTQVVTLTFADASVSFAPEMPCTVYGGWLLAGDTRHDNAIPVGEVFEAPCELGLSLGDAEALVVRGSRLTVCLHGEAKYIEEFTPGEGNH